MDDLRDLLFVFEHFNYWLLGSFFNLCCFFWHIFNLCSLNGIFSCAGLSVKTPFLPFVCFNRFTLEEPSGVGISVRLRLSVLVAIRPGTDRCSISDFLYSAVMSLLEWGECFLWWQHLTYPVQLQEYKNCNIKFLTIVYITQCRQDQIHSIKVVGLLLQLNLTADIVYDITNACDCDCL